MIKLNETAIRLIRDSKHLKKAIVSELNCSERILYRDLALNSPKLTMLCIINIIVEHTGRPLSELIEGGKLSKLLAK